MSASAWTRRLVLFLRVMAGAVDGQGPVSLVAVCGIGGRPNSVFESQPIAWQAATVFFAVIDLVAAVGLWLAAAWGAVVWLTAVVSMAAVEMFFPQVYGGGFMIGRAGRRAARGLSLAGAASRRSEQPE